MDAGDKARAADAPVTPEVPATPVAEAATPEGVDPTVTRVKGASEADKVVPPPTPVEVPAPTATDLADDTLVKVVVDGEEVTLPWKEAKAGISRTSKFTKSMQQLASEKKAFEAERQTLTVLQSEREQLTAFLRNPNAVAAYLQQIAPQQQPAVNQPDPNAVITLGEAQALAQQQSTAAMNAAIQQMQEIAAQKDEQIADAIAALEHKQQTAKHAVVLDTTLKDIFTANPVLNGIPNAEDLIRYNVAMMNPQTEADAIDAFKQVAGGMVENISKHYTNTKKVAAVAQAKEKLVAKTIEPAGGAAPQLQPTSFKTAEGGINWNKVRDMASERYKPLA